MWFLHKNEQLSKATTVFYEEECPADKSVIFKINDRAYAVCVCWAGWREEGFVCQGRFYILKKNKIKFKAGDNFLTVTDINASEHAIFHCHH